jgi:S1-C subfamily serine protease
MPTTSSSRRWGPSAGLVCDAELTGWDPTTSLAVLRVPDLGAPSIAPATTEPRVGHLALAIARSWSNGITASAGIISIIGGPLPTGRHRAIDRVIRTSAPMHEGFAGGAFVDTAGQLVGVTTASTIRGLGVVIPTAIAWQTAATLIEHGRIKRGYLGITGQPVALPEHQRDAEGRGKALLVAGVMAGSPAAQAGVLVGDIILAIDQRSIDSPESLLDALLTDRVGRPASLRVLRGGAALDVMVTIGERPPR